MRKSPSPGMRRAAGRGMRMSASRRNLARSDHDGEVEFAAVGFQTPSLLGLGQLETIHDFAILEHEDPDDYDHDGVRGIAHRVTPSGPPVLHKHWSMVASASSKELVQQEHLETGHPNGGVIA